MRVHLDRGSALQCQRVHLDGRSALGSAKISIPERHQDAKARLPMRKVHDRFSLAQIMTNFVRMPYVDRNNYTHANAIIEKMKDCQNPLDSIADELAAL